MLDIQNQNTAKKIDPKNTTKIAQKPARMPKEKALALTQRLKVATMGVSIIVFGLFGGLIAPIVLQHTTTTTQSTSTQSTTSSSSATGSSSTSGTGSTQTPTTSQGTSQQQSSSSSSSQQQSGGYSFGSSGTTTTPGTSTHVS